MKAVPKRLKLNHGNRKAAVPHQGTAASFCSTEVDEIKTISTNCHILLPELLCGNASKKVRLHIGRSIPAFAKNANV